LTVQIAVFGRELTGREDVLPGYAIRMLAKSANVVPSSTPEHFVRGTVDEKTEQELAAADKYEPPAEYRRISVTLWSGDRASVYLWAGTRKLTQSDA
jgi:hypothetical protein